MATTLYIIRHCEAQGNLDGVFQGMSDCDVTVLGKKQLEKLAERFKDIHLDRVYSSPLIRAYKTAEAAANGRAVEIVDDLREIDGGVIEGMKFEDIFAAYPEVEISWDKTPENFMAPGGEHMSEVYARVWSSITDIVKANPDSTVAVASHGAAIRCLICRVTEGSIKNLKFVNWSDNTAVSKLIFDEDMNCRVEYLNDASHLPPQYIPKKSRITSYVGEKK